MNRVYSIIVLCFVIIGCTNDENLSLNEINTSEVETTSVIINNSETTSEQNIIPVIENISIRTVRVGDIITINGENFRTAMGYIIKFNEVEGHITEIKSTLIKVKVPEGASTGELRLTFETMTMIVGRIEVIN